MPDQSIRESYLSRYETLQAAAREIERDLRQNMDDQPRVDKIDTRPKAPQRFLEKCDRMEGDRLKYSDPLNEIQDQIGARIVTYYLGDVDRIASVVRSYYSHVEEQQVEPDSETEFSYVGRHFILFIPDEIRTVERRALLPVFFELQIKTLFQHAWAEAEHDLNYKAVKELTVQDKRLVAFSAAQAWGADREFDALFQSYRPDH